MNVVGLACRSGAGYEFAAELVDEALRSAGLDAAGAGTPHWNPFGAVITPGQTVTIKPNLVQHYHVRGLSLDCVLTHPSIIAAVGRHVARALDGRGRIVIGDAPLQGADFAAVSEWCRLEPIAAELRATGLDVVIADFRAERVDRVQGTSLIRRRVTLPGPPGGFVAVQVDAASHLMELDADAPRFRVTQYDPAAMREHHGEGRHRYLVPRLLLESDVVVSLPKLKTHRKTGLTGAIKNLVGINGHKDWLPHHRHGSTANGGDEYPAQHGLYDVASEVIELEARLASFPGRLAAAVINRPLLAAARLAQPEGKWEGSWSGNDTLWRTVLDLHRVLLHGRTDGTIATTPTRRHFAVVDAIIAGDGDGPVSPDPVSLGAVLCGESAAALDAVGARLMGFDHTRMPLIAQALVRGAGWMHTTSDVVVRSREAAYDGVALADVTPRHRCRPSAGWRGAMELP